MTPAGATRPRPSIAFVGAGRAAGALAVAINDAGYRVVAIHSRTPAAAADLAGAVGAAVMPSALAAAGVADITFLTVPDSAITTVATTMAAGGTALEDRGVVHCSASRGPEAIEALRRCGAHVAAVHPLQALAHRESSRLLNGSVFAVEADAPLTAAVFRLIEDLGGIPIGLPPGSRPLYHAAAVLAGNAPLALLAAATDLLASAGIDPAIGERGLAALLAGAAANAQQLGAVAALTGPVVRGDAATVAGHLEALRDQPETQSLYASLTAATVRLAGLAGREAIAALVEAPGGSTTDPSSRPTGARHAA